LDELAGRHVARLDDANVAEEQNIRGLFSNLVGPARLRMLLHRALTAEAEGEAELVRDRRQRLVDFSRALVPARHGRNEQWRAQLLTKQPNASVDGLVARFGQGLVNEADMLEQGGALSKRHLVGRAQVEVVCLSLLDIRAHRLACSAAPCRVRSSE
jgi:hypothetical protein